MYTDFKSLPDSMEAEELEPYFRKFIAIYSDKPKNLEALGELYELAYRQWDTYENLNPEIEKQLENYLFSALNFDSYEVTDIIISIVENLTIKNVFEKIVASKDDVRSFAIKKLIIEAEEEYGDSLNNPYDDFDSADDWRI